MKEARVYMYVAHELDWRNEVSHCVSGVLHSDETPETILGVLQGSYCQRFNDPHAVPDWVLIDITDSRNPVVLVDMFGGEWYHVSPIFTLSSGEVVVGL